MNPEYPVYVISKGRWETPITASSLESMGVPYRIVVEPDEYDEYAKVIHTAKILTLPDNDYGCSIPARNYVWQHSLSNGYNRHWILDDNINGFERLNRNERHRVMSGTIFRIAEMFVDRYENVALAGFEYRHFAGGARRAKLPFRINTRIYSCILVNNSLPFRWRGVYNEDTDLSLRALKAGWCTILFQCFLQNKAGTMTMKGGNTDTVYSDDEDRLKFAVSLQKQHPDVVTVVRRWNRWHHFVNYRPFLANRLIRKPGLNLKPGINNYGMKLVGVES